MRYLTPLLITFLMAAQLPAAAQDRLALDLRAGAAVATQDLGDAELGFGLGFQGTLSVRVLPNVWGFGGWGWHYFPSDGDALLGSDIDVEETGYVLGVQFAHPLGQTPLRYFVKAAGTYDHLEIEDADGEGIADTGHGLGWQVGAGLIVPVSPRVRLTPGITYQSLSRELEVGSTTTDVSLRAVSVGTGITWIF